MTAREPDPFDREQVELLSERYLETMLGEPGTTLLTLVQAPIIAGLIVAAFQDSRETPTLHLFLCLAALWVGCMNACREIVKERAVTRRERRVGLRVIPYLASKVIVQGALDLVAAVALVGIVHTHVGLSGSRLLICVVLWMTALTGTALGLAISALVSTSDRAVALVPLAVLPQILFSKAFLPEGSTHGLSRALENLSLLGWSYELYDRVRLLGADPHWLATGNALLALGGLLAALLSLTALLLWADE